MEISSKPFNGYDCGADMWCDNVLSYGVDEAVTICGRYLDMQLKLEISDSEKEFCRELFSTMYEATAIKTDNDRHNNESRQRNGECARGIDEIINNSCYSTNFYNLELAALIAILNYGFARVNLVLVFNIQKHYNDGRYSSANKQWAQAFTVPEQAFSSSHLNVHACLVDSFTDYVRKLQQ